VAFRLGQEGSVKQHTITQDGADRCLHGSVRGRRRRGKNRAATYTIPGCIVCHLDAAMCARYPECSGEPKFSIANADQKENGRKWKRQRAKRIAKRLG